MYDNKNYLLFYLRCLSSTCCIAPTRILPFSFHATTTWSGTFRSLLHKNNVEIQHLMTCYFLKGRREKRNKMPSNISKALLRRDWEFHGLHHSAAGDENEGNLFRDLDVYGSLAAKHWRWSKEDMLTTLKSMHEKTERIVSDLDWNTVMAPASKDAVFALGGDGAKGLSGNPPAWTLGHIAFFYLENVIPLLAAMLGMKTPAEQPHFDYFVLEDGPGQVSMFDSARVNNAERWEDCHGALICKEKLLALMRGTFAAVESLASHLTTLDGGIDPICSFIIYYALIHEAWHQEDLIYFRTAIRLPLKSPMRSRKCLTNEENCDIRIEGGPYMLGCSKRDAFILDCEKYAHRIHVDEFEISRFAVTTKDFLAFVQDAGYSTKRFWSLEGWRWKESVSASAPRYWNNVDGEWFVGERPLVERLVHPVAHVSWWEAQAFCVWSDRRLPSEAEWMIAAGGREKSKYPWGGEAWSPDACNCDCANLDTVSVFAYEEGESAAGVRQMIGNVWEWTATTFMPFSGYTIDFPYREQSAPFFGNAKVAKGGSYATSRLVARNEYRNFLDPDGRTEIAIGFRTCKKG